MSDKQYTIGPQAYSDEWYKYRELDERRQPSFVCGASDAGVICGVSKYKTRLQLYMEIRGLADRPEMGENMEWGKRLEPAIIAAFCERFPELSVSPCTHMLLSITHPMIGATPDAMGYDDEECLITVDAKCTTSRLYDPENCRARDCFGEGEDEIPSDYMMQAQQQMFVTGAKWCYFPVLFDGNHLRVYRVRVNENIHKELVRNIAEFYEQVVWGHAPSPDYDHATTVNLLKQLHGVDPGKEIELDDDMVAVYEKYANAKAEIGRYTKEKETAQAMLLFAMGDASCALVPGTGRAMYRAEVPEKLWTIKDLQEVEKNLGSVKRKSYIRVTDRKAK